MRDGAATRARRASFGALLAGASVACASSATPVKAGAARPQAVAFDEASVGAALRATLDRMRDAFKLGDEDRSRSELAIARSLKPDPEVVAFLDQFEDVIDGRAITRALEREARVEAVRAEVTLGDPIPLRIVLPNVTVGGKEGTLVVARSTGGGLFGGSPRTRTRLLAQISITDLDAFGGESSGSLQCEIPVTEDWVAEIGGAHRIEWSADPGPPTGAVARIVTVGAEALVAQLRFADRPVFVTHIRFAPATVVAFPAGYEALAADPLASLESLLARNEAAVDRSILPAALLVPADRRDDALRLLAAALRGAPPPRARAIVAALRQLTGDRERGLDLAAWLGWASRFR